MRRLPGATLVLLLACAACNPGQRPAAGTTYDVLILNGEVYDGTDDPPRKTHIGVVDDRIVSMQANANAAATLTLDANGLLVVPGFIDPHTHALDDLDEKVRANNLNYLTQAVTTVFVGNDGGGVPDREARSARMREHGIGTNVAFYAGHGLIRGNVMGLADRAPTAAERARMREQVAAEMRAGALGLSTGLFYAPGSYATTGEIVELARVAARFGGVYDSHIRDEASYSIGLLAAIAEALQIGEQAGVPVHIAHLKALGRDAWGKSGDIVEMIRAGRARGLRITADQYPWSASGTRLSAALVPRWAMADSRDAMLARLANADHAERLRDTMTRNLWRRGGSDTLLITGAGEWQGMTLQDVADDMQLNPVAAAIAVIRAGDPAIASFNMQRDDIDVLAAQPWVMTGSDGSDGHPRKFASYPRAYRDLVVSRAVVSMSQFVHRSSGLVADTFSLCDRGYLEEGRKADLAVIDPADYRPRADFQQPAELSTGVVHLLVNGQAAIRDRKPTGARSGRLLTRQACRRKAAGDVDNENAVHQPRPRVDAISFSIPG